MCLGHKNGRLILIERAVKEMSELSHWLSLLSRSRHSNQSCTSAIYEESFLPIFQVFVARFWIHIKIVEVKACIRILKKELGMFQIQVGYLWLTVSMHNSTNSDDKDDNAGSAL